MIPLFYKNSPFYEKVTAAYNIYLTAIIESRLQHETDDFY
jgi:hypothetical protein